MKEGRKEEGLKERVNAEDIETWKVLKYFQTCMLIPSCSFELLQLPPC